MADECKDIESSIPPADLTALAADVTNEAAAERITLQPDKYNYPETFLDQRILTDSKGTLATIAEKVLTSPWNPRLPNNVIKRIVLALQTSVGDNRRVDAMAKYHRQLKFKVENGVIIFFPATPDTKSRELSMQLFPWMGLNLICTTTDLSARESPNEKATKNDKKTGRIPEPVPSPAPEPKEGEEKTAEEPLVSIDPGPPPPERPWRKRLSDWWGNDESSKDVKVAFPKLKPIIEKLDAIQKTEFDDQLAEMDQEGLQQATPLINELKNAVLYKGIADNWTEASVVRVFTSAIRALRRYCKHPMADITVFDIFCKELKQILDPTQNRKEIKIVSDPNENPHLSNRKIKIRQKPDILKKMLNIESMAYQKALKGNWAREKLGVERGTKMPALIFVQDYLLPVEREHWLSGHIVWNLDEKSLLEGYKEYVEQAYEACTTTMINILPEWLKRLFPFLS